MGKPQHYILLVDDDEDDLEMLSSELRQKGIMVKPFKSSEKALFFLTLMSGNDELPLLIIMDYNMPKKNGLQVLLSIKGNTATKDIPVMIYSTSISDALRMQLSEAGAFNCFDKSWTCQEFRAQVEKFQTLAYSLMLNKVPA